MSYEMNELRREQLAYDCLVLEVANFIESGAITMEDLILAIKEEVKK